MKIRQLRLFSFLGLLGLLGLVTDNPGFYGFFGFFAFMAFATVKTDELLEMNIAKAGLNAFLVSLVGLAVAVVSVSLAQTLEIAAAFIVGVFIAQILIFVVFINVYEKKGNLEP